MSHQALAKTAPMGWNSWDCFGAAVNEKELRENADYMAKTLKITVGNMLFAIFSGMNLKQRTTIIIISPNLIWMNTAGLSLPKTDFRVQKAEKALKKSPIIFTPSA